jgi:hypothetical protein
MSTLHPCKQPGQRGAASIAIAIVILLIMTAALFASQTLTGSIAQDAAASDQRVQALFLAESGLERATQRFTNGAACSSASDETVTVAGAGSFQLQFVGASNFDGTACSAAVCGNSYCRIRSTGRSIAANSTTAMNARTIETLVITKSLTATGGKSPAQTTVNGHPRYSLTNTVTSGTSQIYVLTIFWTSTPSTVGKVTGVTYTGAPIPAMISLVPMPVFPAASNGYYAQIYYVMNPPAGTSTVDIDFDVAPAGVAVGALNADGVDPTTPIVGYGPVTATTAVASLSKSIVIPANAQAIDVLSRSSGGNAIGNTCADPLDPTVSLVSIYSSNANKVAGEISYCGAVSSGGLTYNMGYTFGSATGSYAQAVLQPDNTTSGGKRVRFGGTAGALKWHEIVTVPP